MESREITVSNGVKILIVEDSPTQAEQLKYILEQHGYYISVASNGRKALESMIQHRPMMVISDVIMPEMDGYQLCRQIKADENLKDIPVILLTALSDSKDIMKGLECGADNFIMKPYDEKYLLSHIQYILANRELRKVEKVQTGVEVLFEGQKYFINSERQQILDLLISTYETAVQKNLELIEARDELKVLNEQLEKKVEERTAALVAEIAERRRAEERVQQQLARIGLLNRITRAIAERQDLQEIFHVVLQRLEDDLPIDFGGVLLFDPQADTLTVAARSPKSQLLAADLGLSQGMVIPVEQTVLRACTQGEMVYLSDAARVGGPILQKLAQRGIRSGVAVPLVVENTVIGILCVNRCEVDGFTSAEGEFLRMLSEHVALATHQARLHQDLQKAYDELRQTQQAVMQQERLRALGEMASGIAHDINNALSPVVGFANLLLTREPDLSERARRYLNDIQTAGEDIANIVTRMREFYRQREEREPLLPIDLNFLVRQVLHLTRPRWKDIPQKRGIVIETYTELDRDLPPVSGVESEIREALINLIFNAVDAMPQGGTVMIRTRVGAWTYGDRGATHVVLEVTDTGVGMDEETCRRCLEPFFSTKGEHGTGLGLSMVYGVMQRHEGDIEVESAPGQGTTMRLIFPVRKPVEANGSARPEAALMALPPLRVLCIDDEPLLRKLLQEMLENDGHMVEVADGGQAGLERFRAARERGEPFELVLTDLGMPHMDGRQVARMVKRESPATPVILLTGWGTRLVAEDDVPAEVDAVLGKPPRVNHLREALVQVTQTIRLP